jgi:hypothetical protein
MKPIKRFAHLKPEAVSTELIQSTIEKILKENTHLKNTFCTLTNCEKGCLIELHFEK